MTYTELSGLLKDYGENRETSFVANIPQIVKQAESRIYNKIRTMDQRKTVADVVSTGTILPPEDIIEVLYLRVNGVDMMQRQKSFLRTVYADSTGAPSDYALDFTGVFSGASTIVIAPIPTAEVPYELSYCGAPYSIVEQEATYLSVNFSECLLTAALLEAAIYCKAEKLELDVLESRFKESLGDLQRSAEGLQLKDEYRNQPERVEAAN